LSSGLKWAFSYRKTGWLTHVFILRLSARPPVSFPDGEHDAYAWVHLNDIFQPSIPGVRFIVQKLTGRTWNLAPLGDVAPDLPLPHRQSGYIGGDSRRRTNMSKSWPNAYMHWPQYLPFPTAIPRSRRPVPNRSSVDWPQAQFAPLYLPPGSPSFQPYSYLKQDVPLTSIQPHYTAQNRSYLTAGGHWHSMVGPGGDLAQLPSYGGPMYERAVFNPAPLLVGAVALVAIDAGLLAGLSFRAKAKIRRLERRIKALQAKPVTPKRRRTIATLMERHETIREKLAARAKKKARKQAHKDRVKSARLVSKRRKQRAKFSTKAVRLRARARVAAAKSKTPKAARLRRRAREVAKYGSKARSNRSHFVSDTHSAAHAARLNGGNFAGLGLGYGDGMAYELAPLQAAPNSLREFGLGGYGDLALENGDCGCGGARNNPDDEGKSIVPWLVVGGIFAGVLYTMSKAPAGAYRRPPRKGWGLRLGGVNISGGY
jgi:hypothetical protein